MTTGAEWLASRLASHGPGRQLTKAEFDAKYGPDPEPEPEDAYSRCPGQGCWAILLTSDRCTGPPHRALRVEAEAGLWAVAEAEATAELAAEAAELE